MKTDLVVIAHNIRSAHNVGALLRTADGLGVKDVYLTGYTPYPNLPENDSRLPHIAANMTKLVHKTALGAEESQSWKQNDQIETVLQELRDEGYIIAGLEQTQTSIPLPGFDPPQKLVIVLGSEVEGMSQELINMMDLCIEIPMSGSKESFNVVEAASMTLYHCIYMV